MSSVPHSDLCTNIIKTIINSFSGVAFSVERASDIAIILSRYIDNIDHDTRCKISFQTIPELVSSPDELNKIKNIAVDNGFRLVYLGLKETGRAVNIGEWRSNGIKAMRDKFNDWIKTSNYFSPIGIDTQFVKNFPQLKDMDRRNFDWMVTEHEGKFSCCIDLPNKKMSESSYSGELFDISPEDGSFEKTFLEIFSKF